MLELVCVLLGFRVKHISSDQMTSYILHLKLFEGAYQALLVYKSSGLAGPDRDFQTRLD
jgi:hypothetical protein